MTTDELRTAIRATGLRATSQRIAVLRMLMMSAGPLSHLEIARRLAGTPHDRSTVYRNLTAFARAGLVRRIDAGDRVWRFEYAARTPHAQIHPHFICTSCGEVVCLDGWDVRPAGSTAKWRRGSTDGVRVVGSRARSPRALARGRLEVQVRGICDDCLKRAA